MSTLLEHVNQCPPIFYRILASDGVKALTPQQIADRSGLSPSTVQRISRLKKFDGVKMGAAVRFVNACGFDIMHPATALAKLERAGGISALRHLKVPKSAPLWKKGAAGNRLLFIKRCLTQP